MERSVATAPAVSNSGRTLHIRGTWSAREDRIPSAVYLGILWVGMLLGFGLDFSRYLHEKPAAPTVVHFHAVVFSIWMLLLTAQVLLVLRNRVALHRSLGWVCVGWAGLMAILGPWAVMASQASAIHEPVSFTAFLSVNFVDLVGFLTFLAWGIALRQNPAAHKRMMILSSVFLADPGFSRLYSYFWPDEPHSILPWFLSVFYGNILLIALMAAWDWYRNRLMKSFVIGATIQLAALFVASLLYFWPPWKSLTHTWVQAWANHFG